jgi:uncharacterized protein (TIRG00374 family)
VTPAGRGGVTGRIARWTFWSGVLATVGVVTYRNRDSVRAAVGLIGSAAWWWMVPAALAIAGVYLCRAFVYAVPLRLLGYSFTHAFLWATALIATSLHQLLPIAGAAGYAFLTWAFTRGGASPGRASLVALIDTLSYAVAAATVVVASLAYLLVSGRARIGSLAGGFGPGLALVVLAAYLYTLQRDEARLKRIVLRAKRWLETKVGRARWPDRPVSEFLDQYYEAKRIIGKRRGAFAKMVAWQYAAVACDASAVYMAFLALGLVPHVWVVVMGFVLSMAGLAVVSVPAGGGSFEVIMSTFFSSHGFEPAQGIAVALLYRLVAFWLPTLASLALLVRMAGWRAIRRQRRRPGL